MIAESTKGAVLHINTPALAPSMNDIPVDGSLCFGCELSYIEFPCSGAFGIESPGGRTGLALQGSDPSAIDENDVSDDWGLIGGIDSPGGATF